MNRPSTISVGSRRPRARRPARTRRRTYADFRELLDLEADARRLSFASARTSSLPGSACAPELRSNAVTFPDSRCDSSWAENRVVDNPIASPAEELEPGFPEPAEPPALIVVDQRMTMFYGSRRNMKSVIATRAAALIAWRMLAQKKPVGAVIFNDRKIVQLQPHCSRLRVILILHALLNQNHALLPNAGIRSNLTMLNEAMRRTEQLARADSLVFLITDASGHDEETSRLASAVSRDKRLLVALVYDPRQTDFRGTGALDPCLEHQESETGGRHSRGTLHGTFGRQRFFGRRFFPDEVAILPLNTREDVADQLRRALRRLFLSTPPGISLSELKNPKAETRTRGKADEAAPSQGWNVATPTPGDPPAKPWQL
jgi:hypothetical protein